MATITYGTATPSAAAAPKRKSFFARVMDALMEARFRQAEREIARFRHLMPDELEQAGNRLSARNEDALPFGGR